MRSCNGTCSSWVSWVSDRMPEVVLVLAVVKSSIRRSALSSWLRLARVSASKTENNVFEPFSFNFVNWLFINYMWEKTLERPEFMCELAPEFMRALAMQSRGRNCSPAPCPSNVSVSARRRREVDAVVDHVAVRRGSWDRSRIGKRSLQTKQWYYYCY